MGAVTVRRSCWPAAARPVTSRRCWPWPTACAAATPTSRITALGTADGLEARLVPGPRLPAAHDPQGADAAPPRRPTCCGCPAELRGAVRAAGAAIDESRRRGRRRLRRLRLDPGLPRRAPARGSPIVVHEQNSRARPGQPARRPDDAVRRDDVRAARALPHATVTGMPLRREIALLDRAARRDEALAALRAGRQPAHPAGHRRLARRPAAQQHLRRARPTPCAPPACRCCTSAALGKEFEPAPTRSRPAVRRAAVRRPDGPRLRGSRPGGVPRRCQHGLRADRRRPAGGLRPAARSATASSGSTPADVVAAGGGSAGRRRRGHPTLGGRHPAAPARRRPTGCRPWPPRRPGWASARPTSASPRWSARAARTTEGTAGEHARHPLRLRARPRRTRRRWAGCTSSPSAVPACPASRGSCWPGGRPSPGPTPRTPSCCGRWRPRAPSCTSGTTRPTSTPWTRWSSPRPSASPTSSSPAPARAGCGCCTARQALAALMQDSRRVAVAGANGKTTTTSMLTVALQACGADPSFAVGGELAKHGTNAHHGTGDVFVAEADESDGSFLVYRPEVAIVTNVAARPPRLLRHVRGGAGRLRALRPQRPARRAAGRLRRRRRGRVPWPTWPAATASACSPTASRPTPTCAWRRPAVPA